MSKDNQHESTWDMKKKARLERFGVQPNNNERIVPLNQQTPPVNAFSSHANRFPNKSNIKMDIAVNATKNDINLKRKNAPVSVEPVRPQRITENPTKRIRTNEVPNEPQSIDPETQIKLNALKKYNDIAENSGNPPPLPKRVFGLAKLLKK